MKTILSFFLIAIATYIGLQIIIKSVPKEASRPVTLGASQIQTENGTPSPSRLLDPQILIVEKLDINAFVEHVGADEEGRMDVPKNSENVAWWEPGVTPGDIGSAVLAGHFDNPDGSPSVFYNLDELVSGDVIKIEDENKNILEFEVIDKEYFDDATFPIDVVFEKADAKRLNLITCAGSFDPDSKNYSQRLVIFTKLVES